MAFLTRFLPQASHGVKRRCLSQDLLWAALVTSVAACSYWEPPKASFSAVIERIEQPLGDYYTPARGHTALTYICLLVRPNTAIAKTERIRLVLLDLYTPEVFGDEGDSVSFEFAGRFPLTGVMNFDEISNYRITSRRPNDRVHITPAP